MLAESNWNSRNLQGYESYLLEQTRIHKKPRDTLKAVKLSQIETLPEPERIHGGDWKIMDGKVDKAQVMENNNYARDIKN